MFRLIAAHKVASVIIAAAVVAGGTAGGVILTNPIGNTCNGSCITSVPGSGPTTFTPPTWSYRTDSMDVCINNDFGLDFLQGPNGQTSPTLIPQFGGNYCMTMNVSVRFDGQNIELNPLPGKVKNVLGLPSDTAATCGSSNDGSLVPNSATVSQCGIGGQAYQAGWQQFSDQGLGAGPLGPLFTGQTYPVPTFAPVGNTPWQYIFSGRLSVPVTSAGSAPPPWFKSVAQTNQGPINQAPTTLYLMENIMNTETVFMVPITDISPEQSSTAPWVRAHIDASNGKLVCDEQGDPTDTDMPGGGSDIPGEGDVGAGNGPIQNGSCPVNQPDGRPTVVNGPVTTESPQAPVSTCIENCPPPPNPSAAAVAAWKATANDASNIVGAAFKGVANLLPAPEDNAQITSLKQLATIPLGGGLSEDPPPQPTEGQDDIRSLDNFFQTPGLMPGTGSNTGTPTSPSSPSTPPTTPPTTTPPPSGNGLLTPGNQSPADAVDGFYQSELAGDWAAVCSYVTPSAQTLCLAGTSGQGSATGTVNVGTMVIGPSPDSNEALVSVTGNLCAPSSPCVSNSDPATGMPLGLSEFAADYQAAVANTTGSTTVLSPMPCSLIGGKWYVDFG